MSFNADAITLTLIALLAAIIIGILAYAAAAKARARRAERAKAAIRATIIDYFRRSGVQVSADCTSLGKDGKFTAIVESEPMKRFRLSHIIEMTLRDHVRKSCNYELDKIYWRFPIKEATQSAIPKEAAADTASAAQQPEKEQQDDYINEGLENYRHIPKPEVTELPWETFEQMSTLGRGQDQDQDGQPPRP